MPLITPPGPASQSTSSARQLVLSACATEIRQKMTISITASRLRNVYSNFIFKPSKPESNHIIPYLLVVSIKKTTKSKPNQLISIKYEYV